MNNLELTDKEFIDFLLTSEFNDNFSPEQYRYMLHKFRYFYRLLHAKYEQITLDKGTLEMNINTLKELSTSKQKEHDAEIQDLKEQIDTLKSRKLTLRERWSGEIIHKKEVKPNEH